MDKVKQYLAVAGKYHFWILCAVIAAMTLGTWYTTKAYLRDDFEKQKSAIKTGYETVEGIARTPEHPNQEYIDEMTRMIDEYKRNLAELWKKQYDSQGANLQWPDGLSDEFREQVQKLRPIETTVVYDPKVPDRFGDNYKSQYNVFVKYTELPRLAKEIGAKWYPAEEGASASPGVPTSDDPDAEKTIVEWHKENQEFLQGTRFDWSKEPTKRPSLLQILYAQEDLWVLETLIKIIDKTNADADARHNAVVKEIKYLKIGADAIGLSGQVTRLTVQTGPEGVAPGPGAPTAPGPVPGPVTGPTAIPTGTVVSRDPAEGRYVDTSYVPVPPNRLREAFTSTKPDEAFLAVAKRMPVRMHLVVDQRHINRLLAECGNSNLIVEIRQLRMNRPVYTGGGVGAVNNPAAYGPGEPNRGGFGGERGGGITRPPVASGDYGRNGGVGGASGDDERSHHEVDLELYGMVYIYNPVNEGMVTALGAENTGTLPPAVTPATPMPTTPAVPAPVTPMPTSVTPAPVTPMPVTPMPVTPMPVTPMPMPVTPAPVAPMPVVPPMNK